jgi:hypothetical protein
MHKAMRTFAGLVLALCSIVSHAQTCTFWRVVSVSLDWQPTQAAACSVAGALLAARTYGDQVYSGGTVEGNSCKFNVAARNACPSNPNPNCGYATSEVMALQSDPRTGSQCDDPTCLQQAGKPTVVNLTTGYSRGPTQADIARSMGSNQKAPPQNVRGALGNRACEVKIDPSRALNCFAGDTPNSSGMYRYSCAFPGTFTGVDEAQAPALSSPESRFASDPQYPPPPCDGYPGFVGGKPVCIARTNETEQPRPPFLSNTENPDVTGNPTAGSDGSLPVRESTPATGNGGNEGGPRTERTGEQPQGRLSDGTTDKPGDGKEQAECGAPGQPKCAIDESGTPDGKGSTTAAESGLESSKQGVLDKLTSYAGKKWDAWTWTFSLPSGCSPYPLTAFAPFITAIDVCQFQPVIHDLMSMAWIAATIFGCIGLVFKATGS